MKFLRKLAQIPEWLDWILSAIEPIVVLAVAFVVAYVVYWAVFSTGHWHDHIVTTVKELSDNWKAGLMLMVVLFYRTVRMFLEQAEEAFGVKRKRLQGEPLNPNSLESHQE